MAKTVDMEFASSVKSHPLKETILSRKRYQLGNIGSDRNSLDVIRVSTKSHGGSTEPYGLHPGFEFSRWLGPIHRPSFGANMYTKIFSGARDFKLRPLRNVSLQPSLDFFNEIAGKITDGHNNAFGGLEGKTS